MRVIGTLYRAVSIAAAILLAISYLSVFISPAVITFPGFFGLYYLPLAFLNAALLIGALFFRSRSAFISAAALVPSVFLAGHFVRFGGEDGKKPCRDSLMSVMTYNVGRFLSADGLSPDESLGGVCSLIASSSPDIVCLQECAVDAGDDACIMPASYPYTAKRLFRVNGGYSGNVIMSRYPIVGSGTVDFGKSANMALFADINFKGRVIRVYNLHLESNSISLASLADRDGFVHVHDRMRSSAAARAAQVDAVRSDADSAPDPYVICGDFNDTPLSYAFHELSKGMRDTFEECGHGFGATYSGLWPMLRIDYVLVQEENFTVCRHDTPKLPYSDHYPVMTVVKLNI